MADPAPTTITKDGWRLVATNVFTGTIHRISYSAPVYKQTYRETGGTVPTLESEGVLMFGDSNSEEIKSSFGIDVYIYCAKHDGKIRVDV